VLKKHKETKALVADALNDNRETRKLLAELEGIPKDSEAFGAKVAELKKAFQRHVRDDKKEFRPAVIKALSDEEANAIVEKVEGEKAQIEEVQKAAADARRDEIKREREQADAAKVAKDKVKGDAERTQKDADDRQAKAKARKDDDAADLSEQRARADKQRAMVEVDNHVADVMNAGAKVARKAQSADSDVDVNMTKAVRASASAIYTLAENAKTHGEDATSGGQLMTKLFSEQTQHAMEATLAIGRSQTLAEVSEAQSAFVGGSIRRMGEFNARYFALVRGGMASAFSPSQRR
jgi:hypothetical protein